MSDVIEAKTTETEDDESLEDALGATFDTLFAKDDAETEKPAVEAEATDAESDADAETEDAAAEDADSEDDAEDDAESAIAAPDDWTDEDRAHFDKLDATGKTWALARDAAVRDAVRERDEAKARADAGSELDSVVEPIRENLRMAGLQPAAYMQRLVSIGQSMDRDPAGTLKWLASQYRLDANTLGGQMADEYEADPQLQAQIAPLRQQIAQMSAALNQRQQQEQAQQTAAVSSAITNFQQAKDEKGQARFPYFERVKGQMGALLNSDPALAAMADYPKALGISYDRAIRLDDELWKQTLERERKGASSTVRDQAKSEVAKAKKATGGNVKTRNRPGSERVEPSQPDDLKGAIGRAFDELNAA